MFGVFHLYDVDGGFGDAVSKSELVAICEDENLANEYAKNFDKTRVYDKPYAELECGTLVVKNLDRVLVVTEETKNVSPWKGNRVAELLGIADHDIIGQLSTSLDEDGNLRIFCDDNLVAEVSGVAEDDDYIVDDTLYGMGYGVDDNGGIYKMPNR